VKGSSFLLITLGFLGACTLQDAPTDLGPNTSQPLNSVLAVATGDASTFFNGHRYRVIENTLNWDEAVEYCENLRAHLVTINSEAENSFVWELLPQTWLGATDVEVEGSWHWVTAEPFTYTNWNPGEPTNCCPPENCGGNECTPEHYLAFWGEPFAEKWNDLPDGGHPFVCESDLGNVDVDIKPGTAENSINPTNSGVIPVAILTTSLAAGDALDFDATLVDPTSVIFGRENATPVHNPSSGSGRLRQDVDDDGDIDLMLFFETQAVGLKWGDTEACLFGTLTTGQSFSGCDAVRVLKQGMYESQVHGQLRSMTLFINHADCIDLAGQFQILLNGVAVGTAGSTVGCVCNSDELMIALSGPDAKAAWHPGGPNTITVELDRGEVYVGYIRVGVETRSQVLTAPLFDALGGDASTRDICLGYVEGPRIFEVTFR
jgi:hypothetical protein